MACDNHWKTVEKIANKYFSTSKKALIILTKTAQLNITNKNYLEKSATSAISAYILGGERVVHEKNFHMIEDIVKK